MSDRIFVIGIGGTGMRCLESFVHLCGMGMFDDTVVDMLALDTDRDNGNFRQLADLVHTYQDAKGINKEQHTFRNSFFTAKINYYQYSPDYARQETGNFNRLTGYGDLKYKTPGQADLADLLLTKDTREFDLKHGYRAQTSLGSLLMYHSILEEVATNNKGKLHDFIKQLVTAGQARVFVFGSVFGGTGASSIPVIPKAFAEAAKIISPGSSLKDVYFGAVLLTSYFTFKSPSADYVNRQRIVATAEKFALNSQAAMMFYNEDKTVLQTYQRFYMLGTPSIAFQTDQGENETITGGEKQRNNSHYLELFAAFAGHHFFKASYDELAKIRKEPEGARYYYRTIRPDGVIGFEDLVGDGEDRRRLAHRMGAMVAFNHLVLQAKFFHAAKNNRLLSDNIEGYGDIDDKEVEAIERYCSYFNFALRESGEVGNGWLRQIYQSAGGGDRFLFLPDMFGATSAKELDKFKYNGKLYKDDFEKHHFGKGLLGYKDPFDPFKSAFKLIENDPHVTNKVEKLSKRMFQTLTKLYNFE